VLAFNWGQYIDNLPRNIKSVVSLARDFWEIMYGAHIRYNILLQEKHGINDAKSNEFVKDWNNWIVKMKSFDWNSFNISLLWDVTKSKRYVKPKTEKFINQWIDFINQRIYDEKTLDDLVRKQELNNKGNRSKLRVNNDDKYNNWIGLDNMRFRYENAKIIISDILQGLNDVRF